MHFFSLDVLYAPRLPDLYFWWKSCVLYSRFYGMIYVVIIKLLLLLLLSCYSFPCLFAVDWMSIELTSCYSTATTNILHDIKKSRFFDLQWNESPRCMSALCVQCNAGVTVDIGRCLFVGGDNHLLYVCQVFFISDVFLHWYYCVMN